MKLLNRMLVGFLAVSMAHGAIPSFSAPLSSAMRWMPYENSSLHFTLKLPMEWQVKEKTNVIGFTSPTHGTSFGAMGILKSSKKGMSAQEAASRKLGVSVRAKGWKISTTQIAGLPALKVVSTLKNDPTQRIVQYYIQARDDLYLIQCIAPINEWTIYNTAFATMIRTFQFSVQ